MADQAAADPLLLGSASPRRRELLAQLGVPFEVRVVTVDEAGLVDDEVVASVERTAAAKFGAFDPADPAMHGRQLVTADTLVAGAGAVLGKPASASDAEATLRRLSGQELTIASSVCVGVVGTTPSTRTVTTSVLLRALSDDEIRAYVATGAAADKAGALELQGRAGSFIDAVTGCWSNVVGLPLCVTAELLHTSSLDAALAKWSPCSGSSCGANGG